MASSGPKFYTRSSVFATYLTVFITTGEVDTIYTILSLFENNVGIWTTHKGNSYDATCYR